MKQENCQQGVMEITMINGESTRKMPDELLEGDASAEQHTVTILRGSLGSSEPQLSENDTTPCLGKNAVVFI